MSYRKQYQVTITRTDHIVEIYAQYQLGGTCAADMIHDLSKVPGNARLIEILDDADSTVLRFRDEEEVKL